MHWWGQEICNLHDCIYNGGGWCRIIEKERTNIWNEDDECKIAGIILEPELEKIENEEKRKSLKDFFGLSPEEAENELEDIGEITYSEKKYRPKETRGNKK